MLNYDGLKMLVANGAVIRGAACHWEGAGALRSFRYAEVTLTMPDGEEVTFPCTQRAYERGLNAVEGTLVDPTGLIGARNHLFAEIRKALHIDDILVWLTRKLERRG